MPVDEGLWSKLLVSSSGGGSRSMTLCGRGICVASMAVEIFQIIRPTVHDNIIWSGLVRIGYEAKQFIRWSLGKGDVSCCGDIWFRDAPYLIFVLLLVLILLS